MKAQPNTVRGIRARLWCRFFLLAVFATMYVRDVARKEFYEALGLDARDYDRLVIDKTNETTARVFPVVLDVKNPKFYAGLENLVTNNAALDAVDASASPAPIKVLRKLPHWIANGAQMASLFLMLLAGYETSGHTLAFCLWHLALNPDVQTKLREEILEAYQGSASRALKVFSVVL